MLPWTKGGVGRHVRNYAYWSGLDHWPGHIFGVALKRNFSLGAFIELLRGAAPIDTLSWVMVATREGKGGRQGAILCCALWCSRATLGFSLFKI